MDDQQLRGRIQSLEQGLSRLDDLPVAARDQVVDTFTELHEIYGETLARLVDVAAAAGGPELVRRLSDDELVGSMLLLHGLQPATPVEIRSSNGRPGDGTNGADPGTGNEVPIQLTQRPTHPASEESERCELCSAPLGPRHGHVVDVGERELLCACRACTLLFDRPEAGGDHFRRVSQRCERLTTLELSDEEWASLRVPVDVAFFASNGASDVVTAFYPSPFGATESSVALDTWEELAKLKPELRTIEPDVEALLVNRRGDAREYWAIGIDQCYRLVGLVRGHWKGMTGGSEFWEAIDEFFDALRREADIVTV